MLVIELQETVRHKRFSNLGDDYLSDRAISHDDKGQMMNGLEMRSNHEGTIFESKSVAILDDIEDSYLE